MFCPQCGSENSGDARFCGRCGKSLLLITPGLAAIPAQAPTVHYAGFWLRVVARVIDKLVLAVPGVILSVWSASRIFSLPLDQLEHIKSWDDLWPLHGLMMTLLLTALVQLVFNWIYFSLMESSSRQATLGKLALGLKVTSLDGQRISFMRATGRHFGKILSGLIIGIGFVMAGLTKRKQALHDMLANTLVVKSS